MACRDCLETVEYIPMNPVRRGLVKRAEEWKGWSVREYPGVDAEEPESRCGLEIDPPWRDCRPIR